MTFGALVRAIVASVLAPVALSAQTGASGANADSAPVHFALKTLAGDSVRVGAGSPTTLVAVFATWCVPCRDEVPALNMLQRDFGARVRVVAISADEGSDEHLTGWLKQYGAKYPVARNVENTASTLGASGVPVVFLVNDAGHVAWMHSGTLLSSLPELRAKLKALPLR